MNKNIKIFIFSMLLLNLVSVSWAIDWESDLDKALEKAKNESKPVMADFYTDWCSWCKKLDKDVYANAEVNRLAARFICVKVNCEKDKDAYSKYGLRGYPTIIFFNAAGSVKETVMGYRAPPAFIGIMTKVLRPSPQPDPGTQHTVDEPVAKSKDIPAYLVTEENADTIYLNNGRRVSGIIIKENIANVELETGGGSVVISRAEIKKIHRVPPETLAKLKDGLEKHQTNLEAEREAFDKEREKRFKIYGEWTMEAARNMANKNREEGEVKIINDPGSKAILVDAVLNGDIKATLLLDTGADIVVLSSRMADRLGIDVSSGSVKNIADLHLAGGKTVKAKMIILKSIAIQGIEEKNVQAAILLEDAGYNNFKDGLLGMSFLGRFNIKVDMSKMSMVLQKNKVSK